jgi:hypothetical protein
VDVGLTEDLAGLRYAGSAATIAAVSILRALLRKVAKQI